MNFVSKIGFIQYLLQALTAPVEVQKINPSLIKY